MTTLPPFPQGDVGFANAVTKHLRAVSPLHCLTAEAAGSFGIVHVIVLLLHTMQM